VLVWALWVLVVVTFLAVEAARSRRHEAALRARGAVEPRSSVFAWMRVVYPGLFVATMGEGAIRGLPAAWIVSVGGAVFLAAKILKWSAILALGELWSFRVLVVPGVPLVVSGPYRYLRHPNYVALVGEIAGVTLLFGAWIAGPLSLVLFGWLLVRRIHEEERALGLRR
jgi:methyltransferase